MYHAKDGLSFEPRSDGSVAITARLVEANMKTTFLHFPLDADTWASIVAAMSSAGETGETFRRARAFHMGGGKPLIHQFDGRYMIWTNPGICSPGWIQAQTDDGWVLDSYTPEAAYFSRPKPSHIGGEADA